MKKVLVLLIVLSVLMGICACGYNFEDEPNSERPTATPPSNSASNDAPASDSTPDRNPSQKEPPVVTVIDYRREIAQQSDTGVLTHHTVQCPALTSESADAQRINQEIYTMYSGSVETLENYAEGEYIYLLGYIACDYNGVVALILDLSVGLDYGGVYPLYEVYYFDTNTEKQLSYQEYLSALHITKEELVQAINGSGMLDTTDYTVQWAAADESRTYVMIESMDVLDGSALVTIDGSVVNE